MVKGSWLLETWNLKPNAVPVPNVPVKNRGTKLPL